MDSVQAVIMLIEGIRQITSYESRLKSIKDKEKPAPQASSQTGNIDKYEPEPMSPEERAAFLSSIKKKIKSGYYNSDAVSEDLSHTFARALDQTL